MGSAHIKMLHKENGKINQVMAYCTSDWHLLNSTKDKNVGGFGVGFSKRRILLFAPYGAWRSVGLRRFGTAGESSENQHRAQSVPSPHVHQG